MNEDEAWKFIADVHDGAHYVHNTSCSIGDVDTKRLYARADVMHTNALHYRMDDMVDW